MATFPRDVILDILSRLPAKLVVRSKIVCKLWYNLINDPGFIKLHLEQSLATQSNLHFVTKTPEFHMADFDTFDNPIELHYPFKITAYGPTVVGSCHGLLCCWISDCPHLSLFLYNPTTQTHKMLPYIPTPPQFILLITSFNFGFGYDSYSGDYKIVRILQKCTSPFESQVMVYSLKADSWRRVQDLPYYFYYQSGQSAVVGGSIHWVGENDNRVYFPIVSFDLKDETFGSIPLPDFADIHCHMSVGELDACLCLMGSEVEFYKVWIMKEYGRPESWMQLFCISKRTEYELERTVSFSINKKELFMTLLYGLPTVKVDLENMEVTDVKVADFFCCSNTWVCVENLVMLNDEPDDSVSELEPGRKNSKKIRKNKRFDTSNSRLICDSDLCVRVRLP